MLASNAMTLKKLLPATYNAAAITRSCRQSAMDELSLLASSP